MSDPQLPDVPPPAQPDPTTPSAAPLPAEPQGQPAAATHGFPSAPPPASPAAPAPQGYPTATPQGYPTATPQGYPTAAPQGHPAAPQGYPASQAYTTAQAYPTSQGHPAAPAYPGGTPAGQGYPAASAAASTPRARNGLGRTAFLIAAITFGVNLLTTISRPFFYFAVRGFETASFVDGAVSVLSVVAYGFALVLGIVAARRAAPHVLAGIAIGIAGVGLLGTVIGWISTFFYRFI
jgi:hypothetical protein